MHFIFTFLFPNCIAMVKAKGSYAVRGEAAESQPNWKPVVFNPLYLLFLVILHVLHIVGIQLLINQCDSDQPEIDRVLRNVTVADPKSIFIFEEGDVAAFIYWSCLPVLSVLVVGSFWEFLDLTVRRLEPFYQLSSREGGNAFNALCLDYSSSFGLVTPFRALSRRHFTVFLTATAFVLMSIVLPALTGAIFSIEWGSLSFSLGKKDGPKYAVISINPGVALATQVVHGTVIALAIILTIILLTRRTGVYHDPKGIGGLASFISDAEKIGLSTVRLFQQIPSFAHSDDIASALSGFKFHLNHKVYNADGRPSMTYQLEAEQRPGYSLPRRDNYRYRCSRRDANGIWLTRRMACLSEILIWLGLPVMTSAIYYASKIPGKIASHDVGRLAISKIVVTLCITVGGMMWVTIQRNLQRLEPWRQLSTDRPRALYASRLTRHNVADLGLIGSAMFSIVRGSLIMLWAAFCVVMIHIITILAPPVLELIHASGRSGNLAAYNEIKILTGQKGQALGATGFAFHLVILANLVFLISSGRTEPFLPRAPTTIASQILYICHSDKLLESFASTSMLSENELSEKSKAIEQRCRFGWFWWQRGQLWCVGLEYNEYIEAHWTKFDFKRGLN
jgi:hypothetical protein